MGRLQIPSKMSRLRSKTRKVSHQTSNVLSSLVNSLKTEELFLIITSRRSLLFTWSSVFVAVPSKNASLSHGTCNFRMIHEHDSLKINLETSNLSSIPYCVH